MKRALILVLFASLALLIAALVWFTSVGSDAASGDLHGGNAALPTGPRDQPLPASTTDGANRPTEPGSSPPSADGVSSAAERTGRTPAAPATPADGGRRAANAGGGATSIQSLSGRVLGPSGPLAGAELVFSRGDGSEVARVQSDSTGQFFCAFDDALENGTLLVRARGYASALRVGERVQRGERRNLGVIRLEPGLALSGVVVDAAGAPVSDARVQLRGPSLSGLVNRALSECSADRDGNFVFEDAPAMQLRVEARAAGHGARAVDPVHPPSADVRIVLAAEQFLRARVVDRKSGAGVPDARVELAALDPQAPAASGSTDAQGRLTLGGLGANAWAIKIQAPGYRVRSEARIEVTADERSFELEAWPCLRGRVRVASGALPAEVAVRARATDSGGAPMDAQPRSSGSCKADGTFELCDLRPGVYVLEAEAAGWAAVRSGPLQVRLDREVEPVELVLTGGSRFEVRVKASSGTLADGIVEAYSSPPTENELLQLTAPLPSNANKAIASARLSANGSAALEHLPRGRVWIAARARDHLPEIRGPYTLDEHETPPVLEFELSVGVRIVGRVLRAGGATVPGALVILRRNNSAGYAGLRVIADDAGSFESPLLTPGAWSLSARALGPGSGVESGERSAEARVNVELERENRIDLELR
jgi:hypothetical protein